MIKEMEIKSVQSSKIKWKRNCCIIKLQQQIKELTESENKLSDLIVNLENDSICNSLQQSNANLMNLSQKIVNYKVDIKTFLAQTVVPFSSLSLTWILTLTQNQITTIILFLDPFFCCLVSNCCIRAHYPCTLGFLSIFSFISFCLCNCLCFDCSYRDSVTPSTLCNHVESIINDLNGELDQKSKDKSDQKEHNPMTNMEEILQMLMPYLANL